MTKARPVRGSVGPGLGSPRAASSCRAALARPAVLGAVLVAAGCGRVDYAMSSDRDPGLEPDAAPAFDAELPFDAARPDGARDDDAGLDAAGDAAAGDAGELTPDPRITRTWVVRPTVAHPPFGVFMAATYDSARSRVVVYGGSAGHASAAYASHWAWDGTGWTQICDPCAPGIRFGAVMIYDPIADRLVLFGGATALVSEDPSNDVWIWDEGGGWRTLAAGGTSPPPRLGAYGVYDPIRRAMIVFGGEVGDSTYDDGVWELDLASATWSGPFRPTPRPSARSSRNNAATYVPASAPMPALRERMVIYARDNDPEDAMWAWDSAARTWTALCTSCTGRPRTYTRIAYDPATGRLVMVGGYVPEVPIDGTWEGDGTGLTLRTTEPTSRDGSTLTYDPARNEIVAFSGNGTGCVVFGNDCQETLVYVAP